MVTVSVFRLIMLAESLIVREHERKNMSGTFKRTFRRYLQLAFVHCADDCRPTCLQLSELRNGLHRMQRIYKNEFIKYVTDKCSTLFSKGTRTKMIKVVSLNCRTGEKQISSR
jgi:hypothetical protein